jgi:peptide deformylase
MSKMQITEFGNSILRKRARRLSLADIKSKEVKKLISDMRETITSGQYGVGLAAPQVGRSLAISVITIRPTPSHPERDNFETVIINPTYKGVGKKIDKWEGCMSFGSNSKPVFAKAKRYERVEATWLDQDGQERSENLSGIIAHVFQHETDHINGILFVDLVEDSKSWMNESEYKKMMASGTISTYKSKG